ncbi:peroxisomal membrane anchor protein [Colletotrichum plurivorum]|uniref:Peroxisomal membrane protein PEX14 n=1 Tax=Colletotrichum plurivorum TaxID=2175906 RepID=A0A8H6K4P1_9PEZI|nr:peroxisomal membrane anchor protein [Colletotrichum plurivorum]
MTIREDIVTSAYQINDEAMVSQNIKTNQPAVLQDPSVAGSSIENRVAFLRTKNLTQDEIDAALARVGAQHPATVSLTPMPVSQQQQQQYYHPYPPQYTAWQPPPPPPKRDWRDWFIMATVVGGVSYGAYALTKRYVYPMIAPPTPEKLEQDKKSIEEQFDKAFGLVEQLAKDTEALKQAEQQRTEKLDSALADLESVVREMRSANTRRETEAQRIKDDVQILKDSIPKAMEAQREATDNRLKEVNSELTSLKTLLTQRMNAGSSSGSANSLRNGGNDTAASSAVNRPGAPSSDAHGGDSEPSSTADTPKPATQRPVRSSPFSGKPGVKASIPAWQMAMANKDSVAPSAPSSGPATEGSSQQEATSS